MKNTKTHHLSVNGKLIARPDPNYDRVTIWNRLDGHQTLAAQFRLQLT